MKLSVLKRNRTLSKLEFYSNAKKLQVKLLFLLGRDFGIKSRIREPQFYVKKWDKEDAEKFLEILSKYGISKTVDDYPLWMIENSRHCILKHLNLMMDNITQAYTIWATSKAEADLRRTSQDKAIANCEMLKQQLDLVITIFPVKAELIIHYVEQINKEIALLKGWRKSDNQRFKELK